MLLNTARHPTASRRETRAAPATTRRSRWRSWRRDRPFVGGLLVIAGGIALFGSSQLDFGELHIQLGIQGLQATVIPLALVLLGALAIAMPAHRIFYGVLALGLAVYSIVGVNLGGFLVGMILGAVGGILVVSWAPATPSATEADAAVEKRADSSTDEVRALFEDDPQASA